MRDGVKSCFELRVGQTVVFKQAAEYASVEMLDLFYEEVENNPDKLVEIVKVDVVRSTISSHLLRETKQDLEKGTLEFTEVV